VFEIVYTVDHSQHKHFSSSFYTVFQLIWMNESALCTNLCTDCTAVSQVLDITLENAFQEIPHLAHIFEV